MLLNDNLYIEIDKHSIKQEDFLYIRNYFNLHYNFPITHMEHTISKDRGIIETYKKKFETILVAGIPLQNRNRFFHNFIMEDNKFSKYTFIVLKGNGIEINYLPPEKKTPTPQ